MGSIAETSPLLGRQGDGHHTSPDSSILPVAPPLYQVSSPEADITANAEDVCDSKHSSRKGTSEEDDHIHKAKVYPSRFWILGVFSYLACFQCLLWSMWGPINQSVSAAYAGWGANTVAMMANWGTITFVIFVTPMVWLMNTKGLRAGIFCCTMLIATGTVLRVLAFTTDSTIFFTVTCHICAICNGIPGTLVMSAPPMIAADWFPPLERTTAVAIAQVFNQLGNAGSYLQPLLVRSPDDASPEEIRSDIRTLIYLYAGGGVAMLVAVYLYFPSKPPTPPSISSSVDRLAFKEGIKSMLKNRDVILVTFAYSISVGIPSAWIAVMSYSLQNININQTDGMWIGVAAVLVGCVFGLLSGRLTDLVYGHVRISVMILMIASIACFYWFYLITFGTIEVVRWQVYLTIVGGLSFNFATCPLYFELAVEAAYPCPEIIVGGFLTGTNNLVGLSFLFIFLIPNIGYSWVTYMLLFTCSLSLIPLYFVREDYTRSNLDRGTAIQPTYQAI